MTAPSNPQPSRFSRIVISENRSANWPTIAGYEILGELGRGSMGVVYKARQKGLNRLVALKTIRTGAQPGDESLHRFIEEARLVAKLHHPNIIHIYEISLQQELPFFSMELIEGGSLADHLRGRPQPFRSAARFIRDIARAMHDVHSQGIIHRDLKPGNILLYPAGGSNCSQGPVLAAALAEQGQSLDSFIPKVTDFGLAKQLDGGGMTLSGMVLGTPHYMAPEQAEGRSREVGPPADIYALGAILYELLTGRPPYNGETPAETVCLLFQTDPLPPSRLQPRLPRDLETICLKCLHKQPRRRYASVAALADDLDHFLAGRSISARAPSVRERVANWARRRPALATVAVSLLVGFVGLLGMVAWHQMDMQTRLTQAQQDEAIARAARDALALDQRVTRLRAEALPLLQQGEAALAAGDWKAAETSLLRARDRTEEESLRDLRDRVQTLLASTARLRTAREQFQRFVRLRDEVLLNGALGKDTDADRVRNTLASARLAVMEAVPEREFLSEAEKQEITAGSYELLLLLANAPGAKSPERLSLLERASTLAPPTRVWHLRQARALRESGELTQASEAEKQAQQLEPKSALDFFLLGEEQYEKQQWAAAGASFEATIRANPRHFWAQAYLALCRLRTARAKEAITGLNVCLRDRSDLPWLLLLRGVAHAEMGEIRLAEQDFALAQKSSLPPSTLYGLHVNRGVARLRGGNLVGALEDLNQAIALRPDLPPAHINLAQVHLKGGKMDLAIKALDQALVLAGDSSGIRHTRARIHLLRGTRDEALADLEAAIRLQPDRSSLELAEDYLEHGRLLLDKRRFKEAHVSLGEAARLRPGHAPTWRMLAYVRQTLGQLTEALAALDACLRAEPRDGDVLCQRAHLRVRLGRLADAQADYGRALDLRPNAETYTARGWAFLVADNARLALADFETALRLEPTRGDAYAGRGLAHSELGHTRFAIQDAEESLRRSTRTARVCYNAARIFARVSEIPGIRHSFEASVYVDRAAQLLSEAVESLPAPERPVFWQTLVEPDVTLRSIRNTGAFRRLALLCEAPRSSR